MSNISHTWKPQPSGSSWTAEQWQAITARGENILVAAAAGSGKTAVLVNRIIQRMIDEQEALDVDRLLVVTFTNAAAAEMRKRIGEALEKELKENPASLHLRRQLNLLPRSSISTLHSFCMEVIKRYYYQLDLDPHFRIADETEAVLMREEVLEELFEEEYSRQNQEHFYQLVDRYSNDRSDSDLQDLILKLYDFSRSHPRPEVWLDQMAESYQIDENQLISVSDLPWTEDLIRDIQIQLRGALALLERAFQLAEDPQGPEPYLTNLVEDRLMIEKLLQASEEEEESTLKGETSSDIHTNSWEALNDLFQSVPFGRLKPCKKEEVNPQLQQKVKDIRDKVKDQVKQLQEEYFLRSPEDYVHDLCQMAPYMLTLVELVKKFARRYQQQKQGKAMVDFSDLEHYCLNILCDSEAAVEYRQKFEEVLVDEYQDTNMVQEAIIQLVSKGTDQAGNRFMVGDVKQSIYRFRLAEPSLFLTKYKQFTSAKSIEEQKEQLAPADRSGLRIDLAKNFRSRKEVLTGTNFIFKQVMNEQVGEMEYDRDAELIWGAKDYPDTETAAAELLLVRRDELDEADSSVEDNGGYEEAEEQEENTSLGQEEGLAEEDLETVQLEARLMAKKIKSVMGKAKGEQPLQVYDKEQKRMRPATYRDMVILLRSTSSWAPVILEELKQQGIPAYAELQNGYFEAIEVSVMMSLLKVIDNPYQDIPLAAVLRSPIVGLKGEELAQIRIHDKYASYYEALKAYLKRDQVDEQLYQKLLHFQGKLQEWRTRARGGALSDLIWRIYSETGYYDFVSGMSGGNQRQANLRALYDRARQYETTSFRGLFRFLRFIEKMQDRGGDLGTARALGEQEDVVRVMTIHKSKGLEFPIVFVAGLAKQFNMRDISQKFLLHKELGFGTKFVDPELRITYPTLPQLAIKKRMHMELLAEEMRILYVALTRAKEKVYLLATIKNLEKEVGKWIEQAGNDSWLLPDYERSKAKCYIDWVGPALLRHRAGDALYDYLGGETVSRTLKDIGAEVYNHPSEWQISVYEASTFQQIEEEERKQEEDIVAALQEMKPLSRQSLFKEKIEVQLVWSYPYPLAERHRAKQTVTEIKRQRESRDEATDDTLLKQTRKYRAPIIERPRFLQAKKLTAAEIGTAMHMVMQHADLSTPMTIERINNQIVSMVEKELLTSEQAEAISAERIYPFFQAALGQRMQKAKYLEREIPFSLAIPAEETYAQWKNEENELVLVQGVIDCVFEGEDGGLVLVDYKSDKMKALLDSGQLEAEKELVTRYKVQVELYERAIKQIWKRDLKEKYVYFFDADYCLSM